MVTIIIPSYNERANMPPLLERLEAVRPQLAEPLEVLVVDGGSPDGTAREAQRLLGARGGGRVIVLPGCRDLSAAVARGAQEASGDALGVMDADLSHPPELLVQMLPALRSGADVVVASRYVAGGGVADWPWLRRLLSRMANGLARPLVPIADATSGYFLCRSELLRGTAASSRGFKILLELLATTRVRQVREIPYVFTDRARGRSKLGWKVTGWYVLQLMRLYGSRWRRRLA